MATVHIKDAEDFNSKLADAGEKLVIVDFYADWCGPCKMIAPKLEELAKEYGNSVVVLKVNVDECEDLTAEYNITSMPTFLFIKAKKVLKQFSGANYDKLKEVTDELK